MRAALSIKASPANAFDGKAPEILPLFKEWILHSETYCAKKFSTSFFP